MKIIKFSRRYIKMSGRLQHGSTVQLIEVLNSKFEDLHQTFIDYDARTDQGDFYPLPKKGDCLILLFLGDGTVWDTAELFTTVRRSTPDKERYYKGLCGQQMIVEISE